MARKSSAFVEGLQSGVELGTRIMKAREEKAMKKEFAALDETAKPGKAFVVTGADGVENTFADEKMALAAQKAAGESAKLDSKYTVGGKLFSTAEDAAGAAAQLNSPAAKLRQRSEIAMKYNRPDIAEAYSQNYNRQMEANQAEIQHVFNQARLVGDTSAVEKMYNDRLPNGVTAKIVPGENGAVNVQLYKGETLYHNTPYASPDALFEKLAPMAAATPKNMLEIWSRQTDMAQKDRQFTEGQRVDNLKLAQGDKGLVLQGQQVAAQVARSQAEVDNIPIENDLKRQQVAAAQTSARAGLVSAEAGATNAKTNAGELGLKTELSRAPKVYPGVGANGDVSFTGVQTPYNPLTKGYEVKVIGPQAATGMAPTPRSAPKADPYAGLGLGAAPKSDAQILAEMQAAFVPKNLTPTPAPATRNLGGGIQTTFPKQGQ